MANWYWWGKEKFSGKIIRIYTRGPLRTKEDVEHHVGRRYPGMEFINAEIAHSPPTSVGQMDSRAMSFGVAEKIIDAEKVKTAVFQGMKRGVFLKR